MSKSASGQRGGPAEPQSWSLSELAKRASVTPVEISQAVKEGFLTKSTRGQYSPTQAVFGLITFFRTARSRPLTVDKDELREITGLSDQRHRQLANEGFIPAPIKGRWQPWLCAKGVIDHYRQMHSRRDKNLSAKRERKLDDDHTLAEIEIQRQQSELVPVSEMVSRLTPGVAAMRQIVLSSTLTDDERDQLIEALGQVLDDAIKHPISGSSPEHTADVEEAPSPDSQPVGG